MRLVKPIQTHGVPKTSEFKRIYNLPIRRWEDYELNELVELFTQWLKTPNGKMRLWNEQAMALHELSEYNGVYAPIPVGRGKALISLLAPTVLNAKRPILFVPAQLREQTNTYVLPDMRRHWCIVDNLKVVGYSEISLAKNANLLEKLNPDMLIFDEAHYIKNIRSARTKRIKRYLDENPKTVVVSLSGTMTRKSIMDYWLLMVWALKNNAPIPLYWREVNDWAMAIDSDISEEKRLSPGALKYFYIKENDNARTGYQNRLATAPGVVLSSEKEIPTDLIIRKIKLSMPDSVKKAIRKLQTTWETPNGDYIKEATDLYRYMKLITLGFWYRWDPPAPKDWLEARRNWKKFVREILRTNRKKLDSELQIWNYCKKSNLSKDHPFPVYREIKDTFKINKVAEWISDYAIKACIEYMNKNEYICWTEYRAFAEKLSEVSGYKALLDGKQASIDILKTTGPIVASQKAHGHGKNMQDRYNYNLIPYPFSSGLVWEQVIGRTHRYGQKEKTVFVDVFMYTEGHERAFQQAIKDAIYTEETKKQKQKLLYAEIDFNIRN